LRKRVGRVRERRGVEIRSEEWRRMGVVKEDS